MSLSFEDVLHLRLDKLGTATDDWTALIGKLEHLASEARDSMKAKSDAARWRGENAGVTRPFVDKTAKEFQDAVTQATSIRNILRDAHTTLGKAKQDLQKIVDHPPAGVTIWPDGVVARSVHPDRRGTGNTDPGPSAETLDGVADQIKRALEQAAEADETVTRALSTISTKHPYDFSSEKYKSLADFRKQDRDLSIKDADEMVKLAAKGVKTDAELARFNEVLAMHKDNPVFSERFATKMGAEGVMDFYAGLSDPRRLPKPGTQRFEELEKLQKNLGFVLAEATHSDSADMRKWKQDVIQLGPKVLDLPDHQKAYGFQVMSSLMHTGNYDKKFLNDYGNALVATDRKMKLPGHFWNGPTVQNNHLNFDGVEKDFGRDPMTGFLKALSHNPDASTEFFNTTEPQDNAQYVLKDRHYFRDGGKEGGPNAARESASAALFAAASGIDPDQKDVKFVQHTVEHQKVLDRSLKYLSEMGDDLPAELREGMAKALVNHGDTVHRAMSSLAQDESPLDRQQLLEVTKQISRDHRTYGLLNDGINNEIGRDIEAHPGTKESLLRAGQTNGFLEEAKYQALRTDKEDPSWQQRWEYHAVGGLVNALLPGPLADWGQRGVDAITYERQMEKQHKIDGEFSDQSSKVFTARENQLSFLSDKWEKTNPELAKKQGHYLWLTEISEAAGNGNSRAKGLAGAQ
ncbi:DUF6571 family protein [Streptomyces sp. UNOC14_S4]|uniref:DUF6571 family protein n=1 Tax=Streptomyces sp. UNOC14_S4 TaxID=2872340 RepID=UPI001E5E566A|nr:DUF6571 family protein [Streptomyces sp. UNOC14_S4]MCC3771074.1 hypothetical protein [Streptomyces sp. UNOC14_S4]